MLLSNRYVLKLRTLKDKQRQSQDYDMYDEVVAPLPNVPFLLFPRLSSMREDNLSFYVDVLQ
jgi:hypothetical protein